MKHIAEWSWRLGVAGMALTLGAILVLHALATLSADLRRLERKTADLGTLQKLAADWKANQQALLPFAELPAKQPVPLAELAAQNLSGVTPSIRQRETMPALAGWQVRRGELKCETSLAVLGKFLLAAASNRPPWRLTEFELAAGSTSGTARVTLVLDALEKK